MSRPNGCPIPEQSGTIIYCSICSYRRCSHPRADETKPETADSPFLTLEQLSIFCKQYDHNKRLVKDPTMAYNMTVAGFVHRNMKGDKKEGDQ